MKLYLKDIPDVWTRKSLELVQIEINDNQPLLRGLWKFFELTFSAATTNQKIVHNLGFQPKDMILTSTIGPGSFKVNFELTDKDFLDVTTTGQCKIRAFIGTYREGVIV